MGNNALPRLPGMTPSSLAGMQQWFRGTYYIKRDGGCKFFSCIITQLPNNTASHPGRQWYSHSERWQPEISLMPSVGLGGLWLACHRGGPASDPFQCVYKFAVGQVAHGVFRFSFVNTNWQVLPTDVLLTFWHTNF
jgi:hypothetical protein